MLRDRIPFSRRGITRLSTIVALWTERQYSTSYLRYILMLMRYMSRTFLFFTEPARNSNPPTVTVGLAG